MKPATLSAILILFSFLFDSQIYSQLDQHTNQIIIRSDRVFELNGNPFFPIMLSHELGAENFNSELKKVDGSLYGFNVINLHKQVKFLFNENCWPYGYRVREVISGDVTSGSHYTSILGNMGWDVTWNDNANRIFDYLGGDDQSVYILSDDYAFYTSTISHFVQNCGSGSCEDFVPMVPRIDQTIRNNAIDRIDQLAKQSNSKLIGFFTMDDANLMGTYLDDYACNQQNGPYFSQYYFDNIDTQIQELTTTYQYAKSVYPKSIVYMAAPPVFYPRALDVDNWGSVPLTTIRNYWKDAAHRLAGATDVMYAMFYNFESWGWNWRIYDGPGYPSWYLEHLDVMKNEVISGYREPKAILGGYWMDGAGFLPSNNSDMPKKLKWATYVGLAKGATGLNFFGWHFKDFSYFRPYWDETRRLVDTLANIKNLDDLVFTKTNSGPVGHTLTGSGSQNITHAVYKVNNWNEYYLLVTNNPNGSIDGTDEGSNLITIGTNTINLCYYDIKEVFSNNSVIRNTNHEFQYEFPWFGTALFHIKLKKPAPNDCVEEKPGLFVEQTIPDRFFIKQNYPNPFNPSTEISFGLPKDEFVTIEIYNSIGQKVTTLMNEFKTAGVYEVVFEGKNYSSGMYIYKIKAGVYTETKKMLLIK